MRSRLLIVAIALGFFPPHAEVKSPPLVSLSLPGQGGDGPAVSKRSAQTVATGRESVVLRKSLEAISDRGHRRGEVLRAFALFAACAVSPRIPAPEHPQGSVSIREDEYMAEVKRWDEEEMGLFKESFHHLVGAMEAQPYTDLFGHLHMDWRAEIDRKLGGEFYTPQELCRLMARMNMPSELPADRPLEVNEPACGVGRMMLAAAEVLADRGVSPLCMRATCIDIDRMACDMCYVNLTLWGIPAVVVHGNALSLETWGSWRNIFWPMAHGAGEQRLADVFAECTELVTEAVATVPDAGPAPLKVEPSGQVAFDLDFGGLA